MKIRLHLLIESTEENSIWYKHFNVNGMMSTVLLGDPAGSIGCDSNENVIRDSRSYPLKIYRPHII